MPQHWTAKASTFSRTCGQLSHLGTQGQGLEVTWSSTQGGAGGRGCGSLAPWRLILQGRPCDGRTCGSTCTWPGPGHLPQEGSASRGAGGAHRKTLDHCRRCGLFDPWHSVANRSPSSPVTRVGPWRPWIHTPCRPPISPSVLAHASTSVHRAL